MRPRLSRADATIALAVVAAVLAFVVPAFAGDGPPPEVVDGELRGSTFRPPSAPVARPPLATLATLREAAADGRLLVQGFQPSSYQAVHIRLRNKSAVALRVDLCGSYLEPRKRGSCQRLGIGPVVTPRGKRRGTPRGKRRGTPGRSHHPRPPDQPPGTVVIDLEAGEEKVVHVRTCCLDAGKPAPRGQVFRAAKERLPPVREEALRWWADNPDAPQGMVNRAIWQSRPIDDVVPADFRGGERLPPLGRDGVAVHAGTVYVLQAGNLLARDPDGVERFLGTQMDGVFPTDSAVYGISYGRPPPAGQAGGMPRELWRLVHTGNTPWKHVVPLPYDLEVHDVQVAASGAILLITSKGLYGVDTAARRLIELMPTEDMQNLSVGPGRGGRIRVTTRRPATPGVFRGGERTGEAMPVCELWDVDPRNGDKERVREFWNVRQVRTGPAGLYALTPGGKLRRLVGRSFRNAPGQAEYERIVHVGRKSVWVESKKGRLVAVGVAGQHRFEAGPRTPALGSFDLDAQSDHIVFRASGHLWDLEPKRGKRRKLEPPANR